MKWILGSALMLLVALFAAGCAEKVPPRVVIYTLADRETALPIFAEFTKATGINVHALYDEELSMVADLAQAIASQPNQSRCDLFWDTAILTTLELEQAGVLRDFNSPNANTIASDARVLIVNVRQLPEARRPKSIHDLTDPQWYERVGIARPLTGPPATHAACLFVAWGDTQAKEFFLALKRNARILADDAEVAHAVATGRLAFGLTSASAANAKLANDAPVAIIYPDQGEGALGALFVPSTVALLKESPNPEPAATLLNYLLSPDVRKRLDRATASQVPVRAMPADFAAAADRWDDTSKFLQSEFAAP